MNSDDRKQIALVLYPGLTPLDLIGPLQTLAPLPRIDPAFEIVVVAESDEAMPTDAVIKLAASHTFDDAFLTTAGVSAGIDGALYLASRLVGEDFAMLIQRGLEYEPQPPFGPIDWDPAIVEAVRPIWRGSFAEVLAAHPYLARDARLGGVEA